MNNAKSPSKLVLLIVTTMIIMLSLSNIAAYTDGEIMFEDTLTIDASGNQSVIVNMSSDYDTNTEFDGFKLNFTSPVNSNLTLVYLRNAATPIEDNSDAYEGMDGTLGVYNPNITGPGFESHFEIVNTENDNDRYSFKLVFYNQKNSNVTIDLVIAYAAQIVWQDNSANFSNSTIFGVTIIMLTIFYRTKK